MVGSENVVTRGAGTIRLTNMWSVLLGLVVLLGLAVIAVGELTSVSFNLSPSADMSMTAAYLEYIQHWHPGTTALNLSAYVNVCPDQLQTSGAVAVYLLPFIMGIVTVLILVPS